MGKQIGSKINNRYFPEKLTYDGFQYRTTRINEAMNLQSLINSKIQSKKNGTNPSFLDLSHEVSRLVQNSNHLLEDLKLMSEVFTA